MRMKIFIALLAVLLVPGIASARQTVITGTVLGHNGKPIPAAHVHLERPGVREAPISVPVAKDGSYSISTDLTGTLLLQFTGVDHAMKTTRLVVIEPRDIRVDARLGTRMFGTAFDKVTVIGDFNKFSFDSPQALKKNKKGLYEITFKTTAPRFAYQLVFTEGVPEPFSVNGTMSDAFEYDGSGDYRSVVTPKKGSVTITFDPARLPQSAIAGTVTVQDAVTSRLATILDEMDVRRRRMTDLVREWKMGGSQGELPMPDWSADVKKLRDEIAAESDPVVRGTLMIAYAGMSYVGARDLDSQIVQRALAEIKPTSALWTVDPGMLNVMIRLAGTPDAYEEYRWDLVRNHPSEAVRVRELYFAISSLCESTEPGAQANFERYYRLMQSNYPQTREAMYTKTECDPDRPIRVGRPVPSFTLASFEDPNTAISNESLRGQVYLIDFWATWCGPCVAEMKGLHEAYEKYHGKNFTIVSFSFDQKPQDIAQFRGKKWNMPWKHAFIDDGFNSDLAQRFGVMGIPKPILVDASGTIIATERDLRGPALDKTLERVLGGEVSEK